MAELNQVMLIGNLTKDADLKRFGERVLAEFRIASNRSYTDAAGEKQEEVCFITCGLWGKRGEAVHPYLTKGKPVFVRGRLKFDQWKDQDGNARSAHKLVVEDISFLPQSPRPVEAVAPTVEVGQENPVTETAKRTRRTVKTTSPVVDEPVNF